MAMTSQGGTFKLQGWKAPQRVAIIWLAICLLLISMVALTSAASQTWYLSSSEFGTGYNYTMYRGSQLGGVDNVSIPKEGTVIWLANEIATTDVTFPSGTWSINLTKGQYNKRRSFTASIGVQDTSAFTAYGNYTGNFYEAQSVSFPISASGFAVSQGQWLAFRVINLETNHNISIQTAGVSNITSPSSSPDYPVPELSTFLLFGVGLLALVGYVGYRKRRGH